MQADDWSTFRPALLLTALLALGCAQAPLAAPAPRMHALLRAWDTDLQRHIDSSLAFLVQGKNEEALMSAAKSAVAAQLKHPGSARFQEVHVVTWPRGKFVCGLVHAPELNTGFIGFTQFIAGAGSATIDRSEQSPAHSFTATTACL